MKLLAWLCLATGALAWPLAAEEITVTIPPDPPAAAQAEAQQQPAPSAESVPVAQDTTPAATAPASPPEQPAAAPASQPESSQPPASPPAQAAAPEAPAPVTSEPPKAKVKEAAETSKKKKTPSHAANSASGKSKTKKTAASCKGLTEDACGTNSACIWVVGTPAEGEAKATKARCRSFAVLKKEAKKHHQAAKTKEPEVLPWATQSPAGSAAGTPATSAVAASPSAVKQQ
jgi:hypothetical protein